MGPLMEIRMGYGPLMEFWDQRILAFISGLKTQIAISGKSRENGGGDWVAIGTRFQE